MSISIGKFESDNENLFEKTTSFPSMLPVTFYGQEKQVSPEERGKLIKNLKKEIEQIEHWYLDSESRKIGEILVFDTNNENSSPKIMSLKEREETFNGKRMRIQQQLESLKWKHKLCTKCEKYKKREEFRSRKDVCQNCYSESLRSVREKLEKKWGKVDMASTYVKT